MLDALGVPDQEGRGNVDRGVRTDHDSDEHRKGKAFEHISAKEHHHQKGSKHRDTGDERTAECFIQRVIHKFGKGHSTVLLAILTNTVEHHHLVVDGVAKDREIRSK